MFTVSFIFKSLFNLLGVVFGYTTTRENTSYNYAKIEYFLLIALYRKFCFFKGTGFNFFEISTIVFQIFSTVRCGCVRLLVVVLFNLNRLKFYNLNVSHSTIRNADVLYLDRFSNDTSINIVRRVVGFYNFIPNVINITRSDWQARFSPTTIVKYVNNALIETFNVLYLRKTKVFNKGRYSRNRQFYRTGVYWCLYINIIAVIGMYFWFYRFVMNFGYLWWMFYISLASFVAAKTVHFRFYLPTILVNSLWRDLTWFSGVVGAIFYNFISLMAGRMGVCYKKFSDNFSGGFGSGLSFMKCVLPTSSTNYIFMWFYSPTNYYINSLTTNPARIFLASGKNSYFIQLRDLLTK